MVLSGIPYSNSSKQRNLSNSENCILQICSGTKISHNWAWWFLVTKEKACRRRFSNNWGCSSRFLHPHNSLLEFVFVWQEATFWLRPYRTLVSSRESPDHVCRYLRPNGWCLWVIKTRKTKKKLGRRTQTFFWCCFFPSVVFGGWSKPLYWKCGSDGQTLLGWFVRVNKSLSFWPLSLTWPLQSKGWKQRLMTSKNLTDKVATPV